MKINSFHMHNYRSLRKIQIRLPRLAVLAGVNAAGKSNFCDALDFLSEVYKLGLRVAVARKGGYENICFRRARRSKGTIEFGIEISISQEEAYRVFRPARYKGHWEWVINHTFGFKATSERIGTDFRVLHEELSLSISPLEPSKSLPRVTEITGYSRSQKTTNIRFNKKRVHEVAEELGPILARRLTWLHEEKVERYPETELLITYFQRLLDPLQAFSTAISSFRVFQISPRYGREPGVPIPQPELDRFGSNLPTILAFFRDNHPKVFTDIVSKMRSIIPELETIEVDYVYRKRYGLTFKENAISRPWTAEDVSDGTIQTLAMLAAILDPRSKLVAIEEPENSVHSWILSNLLKTCREASDSKYVFLTTHSMSLIDLLQPEELYVVYKAAGKTRIDSTLFLNTEVKTMLEDGVTTLGEYIQTGAIPEIVPPGEQQ
jgi:predicted ATPase